MSAQLRPSPQLRAPVRAGPGAGFPGLQIKEGPSRPPLVGCLSPPAFPAGGGRQRPLNHSASRASRGGDDPGKRGSANTAGHRPPSWPPPPRKRGQPSAACRSWLRVPVAPGNFSWAVRPQSDNTDPAAGGHPTGLPPSVQNDPRTPIATGPGWSAPCCLRVWPSPPHVVCLFVLKETTVCEALIMSPGPRPVPGPGQASGAPLSEQGLVPVPHFPEPGQRGPPRTPIYGREG